METGRTIPVNDQPPASQLTTGNTVKHNALEVTGWGRKMQGQTKKYNLRNESGDFLRLAKRTLVSFGNHTCNFAIMFWCICINLYSLLYFLCFLSFGVNTSAGHTADWEGKSKGSD
jgi:hypothetical protein